jgi:plastocyanin
VNAFHVIGGVWAIWAITLTAIGVRREDFPSSRGQTLAVGAVSLLLAVGTISAGIITTALEDHGAGGHEAKAAEEPAGGGGGQTLRLSADPSQLRFDKAKLEARAGKVTIDMKNPAPIPHNVSLESDGEGKTVGQGGTSTVSAGLKPGEYVYYCSVPGHREAGMEGTLTVR